MSLFYQVQGLTQLLSLTQVVSEFAPASQLQKIRTYKWGELWGLGLEFHPAPGLLLLACGPDGGLRAFRGKPTGQAPASHPLSLYLKAHAGNARVESAHGTPSGGWELRFLTPGLRMVVEPKESGASFLLEVEGRKPYRQELRLARLALPLPATHGELPKMEMAAAPALPNAETRKREKLLENIRGDIREAEVWLARWRPVLERLESDPSAWKRVQDWTEPEQKVVADAVGEGDLPSPSGESMKAALSTLFARKRRAERRLAGGRKRLGRVEVAAPVGEPRVQSKPSPSAPVEESPRPALPRKKPGVWVELREGVWARVGRSSSENDELFRQARDRDLWFHVRGGAGGHVWIPRGQPGFGAKSDPPEDLVRLGCQLALINSKSAASGRAVVDFTERRSLRRIRSAEGAVEILRSETRSVRLDEAFERKVMRKGEG